MEGDKVLIVNRLLVDIVPVVVIEIHGRNPLLFRRHNHPPDAAEAVQVDYEEKDQFIVE